MSLISSAILSVSPRHFQHIHTGLIHTQTQGRNGRDKKNGVGGWKGLVVQREAASDGYCFCRQLTGAATCAAIDIIVKEGPSHTRGPILPHVLFVWIFPKPSDLFVRVIGYARTGFVPYGYKSKKHRKEMRSQE